MHGRPESSFRLESNGKVGVYSFLRGIATDEKYKRFVTFWPQFAPYWKVILPADKVRALTPPVDLQSWNPDGPRGYQFHGKRGTTNIVIADMWRDDITPFHVVHAAAIYCQKHHGAKLHLYGLHRTKALDVLLAALESIGVLGEAVGMVDGLANVYRAADMLVSPHAIATRAIREAMACGCPVIAPLFGASYDIEVMATDMESVWTRDETRKYAEQNYDSRITADEMIALVEEALNRRTLTCDHGRTNDHGDACLDCGAVYVSGEGWQ
jgi:glycosyltransferase involved in cell wall biosynthesis